MAYCQVTLVWCKKNCIAYSEAWSGFKGINHSIFQYLSLLSDWQKSIVFTNRFINYFIKSLAKQGYSQTASRYSQLSSQAQHVRLATLLSRWSIIQIDLFYFFAFVIVLKVNFTLTLIFGSFCYCSSLILCF